MTWTRFSYICRRALRDVEKGAAVAPSLQQAETGAGSELYGQPPRENALPRMLLDRLEGLPDRDRAVRALDIYARWDLASLLSEPLQLKRVIVYLTYVACVFYVTAGVYVWRVTPRFVEVLSTFEAPLPTGLLLFEQYWLIQLSITSGLLLLCLLSILRIRQVFQFKRGATRGLAGRLLLAPGIRACRERLDELLTFPLDPNGGPMSAQLSRATAVGLDVGEEGRALLELDLRELTRRCDRQQQVLSTIVALAVLQAVVTFLCSAYAPIFVMGEMI